MVSDKVSELSYLKWSLFRPAALKLFLYFLYVFEVCRKNFNLANLSRIVPPVRPHVTSEVDGDTSVVVPIFLKTDGIKCSKSSHS